MSLSGKSYIVGKLRCWTFSWCEIFFYILKIFWVINFWTKIVYFFTISKNVIYTTRIKKIFFLWKVLIVLIILQESFWKNLSSLIRFLHCELHTHFETMKIVYFLLNFFIKCKKFTVLKTVSYWDHDIIINECIFLRKHFCKTINETRSFHKKNIFLIRVV